MRVGGCCPPAGLEVGGLRGLVGLELWPPCVPALPPGPSTLRGLSASLWAAPGTRREYCSGPEPKERGGALWAAQAAAGTRLTVRAVARPRWAPRLLGCRSGRRGRVRVPKLFARDPFIGVRFLHR